MKTEKVFAGKIEYTILRKKVKNVNLRIQKDLSVVVSANSLVPRDFIDKFVLSKQAWIEKTIKRLKKENLSAIDPKFISDEQAYDVFCKISDEIYPQFKSYIAQKPEIKVKTLKSCWGVCHVKKNYITLNKMLLTKPFEAIEYVVMHEYVHFIHQNHGEGFHKEMKARMPDYIDRRGLLR